MKIETTELYNEERKLQFVRDYTDNDHTMAIARTVFGASKEYEVKWGADLCSFTLEQLQEFADNELGIRVKSRQIAYILLKEYVKWCLITGVPDTNDVVNLLDMTGIPVVRRHMVSSPLHLQKCLDEIFDPESDNTVDNLYRCYYWMAYAGMQEKDTVNVKNDDVDFLELAILQGESAYYLHRESLPAFRNAVYLTEFVKKHSRYMNGATIQEREDCPYLFRSIGGVIRLSTIRSTLSARIGKAIEAESTNVQISYQRVYMSGLFYRMYERERAGYPISFLEEAARKADGKIYKLNTNGRRDKLEHRLTRYAKEYLDDYERWKEAFNI